MMSKVVVLGRNGQIGWELQRSLGLVEGVTFLSREDEGGNLLDLEALESRLLFEKPLFLFNAAGYTAVDAAENDMNTAMKINAQAVGIIAEICAKQHTTLIHYSTDYVFGKVNKETPWVETDDVCPLNKYGDTKAEGERRILSAGCRAYIFRTSWVYGVHRKNFMKTILDIGKRKSNVEVVSDQIGIPTSAEFLADVSTYVAFKRAVKRAEIVNLVPNGQTSWSDYARYIFSVSKQYGIYANVTDISSSEYPTIARRPLNSLA